MKDFVVIPTYNERENIKLLVPVIFGLLPEVNILVVDDNSPDGTAEIIRDLQKKYSNLNLLENPKKNGLGNAYISGFKQVLNDNSVSHIITMDADFSHSPADIKRLLDSASGYGLVIGSRYVRGGSIAKWELWRRILSWGGNLYVRLVLRYPIRDWTSGFTCISVDTLRRVNLDELDLSGYAFLQELKYLILRADVSFMEIPILFGSRREGESKISGFIIREGITGPWKMRLKK